MAISEALKEKTARINATRAKARRVAEHAATVAANALAMADGEDPIEDPEEDTVDPGDLALPPPPPIPTRVADKPAPPSPEMQALASDVPNDPLAAINTIFQMLVASSKECVIDKDLSPRERRKELRTIAVAAEKLLPKSRLYEAEQIVLRDKAKLERKTTARAGAKLQPLRGKKSEPDFGD